MISRDVITAFLNRELDNFEWVKKLKPSQINKLLSEVNPNLVNKMWLHQKMLLLIMQYQTRFMIYSGMGSGKSYTVLAQIDHIKKIRGKVKAVVFVPYLTAVDTWINETAKHTPDLVCCPLLGTSKENLELLRNTKADLYPICYQTAIAALSAKVDYIEKKKNKKPSKKKKQWLIDPDLVDELFYDFDMMVIDEAHKVGNSNSQTFILCDLISSKVNWVYGLTGTPFGNDPQSLWSEFYLVDRGETLGDSIKFFREIFFTKKAGFWGGVKYEFKKRLSKRLQAMVKNKSIHFATHEMVDIPEKIYIKKKIHLGDTVRGHIDKAWEDLKAATSSRDVKLLGSSFLRLRQLSSGFLTFSDGDNRIKIKFKDNYKLDALSELVESMPPDSKMVVFHEYIFTNEMISERLTRMKVGHARIWGGQRDPIGQLQKFREDQSCRVLVINSKSGSSSLNLQFANIMVFYECPSVIDRAQAEARCWRPGQTQKVLIYDLLVNGTIDEEYYDTVREGGDLLKQFLEGKRNDGNR